MLSTRIDIKDERRYLFAKESPLKGIKLTNTPKMKPLATTPKYKIRSLLNRD